MLPQPGDVLEVDGAASVQFGDHPRLLFRVIAVSPRATYEGWVWLTGYVVDRSGSALERREIFVRAAGLRRPEPGKRETG
jgi:hypothetical protein